MLLTDRLNALQMLLKSHIEIEQLSYVVLNKQYLVFWLSMCQGWLTGVFLDTSLTDKYQIELLNESLQKSHWLSTRTCVKTKANLYFL